MIALNPHIQKSLSFFLEQEFAFDILCGKLLQ